MLRHLLRTLATALLVCSLPASAKDIMVIYSSGEAGHQQLVDVLEKELAGTYRLSRHTLAADQELAGALVPGTDLVITVGVKASRLYLKNVAAAPPQLAVMLPRLAYQKLEASRSPGVRLNAVFVDQPLSRQMTLIRAVMPRAKRIGVVFGEGNESIVSELKQLTNARGLELVSRQVSRNSELYPALQGVLQAAEVLLALPDPEVINAGTAQNLLLTSYRYRKPVIAYSAGYVRAGALAGLYSSPAQIAQTAARRARELLERGSAAQEYSWPADFGVMINRNLAENLGIEVPEERQVLEMLRRSESSQ